ncbi:MAG: hypothetical protein J5594_03345 [Elusimicrobiaceae bacterium]|nr:hypothetical protein [Elusimicrobiaceae bacterium]
MGFLRRNSGKIALLAIIAFFTLPFIYSNEEEEDFSPFAVKSGMSYQSNPISKLANKIASFYGFSKPVSGDVPAPTKKMNFIKEKVASNHAFNKGDYLTSQTKTKQSLNSQNGTLVASSRNFKNFDLAAVNAKNPNRKTYDVGNNVNSLSDNVYPGSYNGANSSPIKGYVTINGQNYDVIEDAKGDRYVVTPKGHIPYKEIMKKNISEQEFLNAKKRFPGASDMEILNALQREKQKQAYSSANNQISATSYRNGTASNMGGMNYARVSTNDKGFDDNALSNAYANLKGINLKMSSSTGGNGGGYSGSDGTSRGFFAGGSSSTGVGAGQSPQDGGFTAAGFARETRTQVKAQIQSQSQEQENEKLNAKAKTAESESDVQLPESAKPVIRAIYRDTNGEEEVVSEEREGVPPTYYKVINAKDDYKIWPLDEEENAILPVMIDDKNGTLRRNDSYRLNKEDKIKVDKEIGEIDESALSVIKAVWKTAEQQDKTIYIDCSNSDDVSRKLLKEKVKSLNNIKIISKPNELEDDKNNIVLPGPTILTSQAFKDFKNNVDEKLKEIQETEDEDLPF